MATVKDHTLGWIGTGRMGFPMVERLLNAGADVAVWNRTRAKAEPLAEKGAVVVGAIQEQAARDIVFTMVTGSDDFIEVTLGDSGVLRAEDKPRLVVDCSTISEDASRHVRAKAAEMGVAMLDCPVSGNNMMVAPGLLSVLASGRRDDFELAKPFLAALGSALTYVGEGESARIVKICHNIYLGIATQAFAEMLVLAERHGVSRRAFMDFCNTASIGSRFTQFKTDAFARLDWTPTFTGTLMLKDMDLGLAAARAREVPMPVARAAREIIQSLVNHGYGDADFGALVELEARNAGLDIQPEPPADESGKN